MFSHVLGHLYFFGNCLFDFTIYVKVVVNISCSSQLLVIKFYERVECAFFFDFTYLFTYSERL